MANRPGGQPRFGFAASAPRTGSTGATPPSFVDPNYLSPFKSPFDGLNLARPGAPKTARQIADACRVLPDPIRPPVSAAQLAAQRQAIDRAFFMADSPLAGTAYGLATALGASPRARDIVTVAGAAADALVQGAAPRGALIRARPSPPPRPTPGPQPLDLPPIGYRERDELGRARGINGILVAPLAATTERVPEGLVPPGLQPRGLGYWNEKLHLAARQLGGSNEDPRNFAAGTRSPTNSEMQVFENKTARRVRGGERVDYSVTPLYGPVELPPELFLMTASGPKEGPVARLVRNPRKANREAAVLARVLANRGRPRR